MKKRISLAKLTLNKRTVANLSFGRMRAVKGGEPPVTEQWLTQCCPSLECLPPDPVTDDCNLTGYSECFYTCFESVLGTC
jgi:hypothetical protein